MLFLTLRMEPNLFPAPSAARTVVVGAIAGIAAVAFHSLADFSLRIPANAVLLSCLVGLRFSRGGLAG